AQRGERGLERRLPAVERWADDADLLRRGAGADEREQLLADELEHAARACGLEETKGAVDRRRGRRRAVGKQRPLEVGERRRADLLEARGQLLDAAVGERGEVLHRADERCEGGAARL